MNCASPADLSPLPRAEPTRDCPLCPRLVAFRNECRAEYPDWYNAPVPAFGDPDAWLAIVASPEEPNGTGLMLEPNSNPIAKTYQEALNKQGLPVIVFGVDDVQKEYERLKARGVVFTQEPTKSDWGTQAVFDDTFGNFIQIHQA